MIYSPTLFSHWPKSADGVLGEWGIFGKNHIQRLMLNNAKWILSVLLLVASVCCGQVTWQYKYKAASFSSNTVTSIKQTSDRGYIVAGGTSISSFDGYDFLLMKLDSMGIISWCKTLGSDSEEWVTCMQPTFDGGFIVSGYTYGFGAAPSKSNAIIIKTNASGNVQWSKMYTDATYSTWINYISQNRDSSYILCGNVGSKSFIQKIDTTGNAVWGKIYYGPSFAEVHQTIDGGFIIAGSIYFSYFTPYLAKVNAAGSSVWRYYYAANYKTRSIVETPDSGFILVGNLDNLNTDINAMKVSSSGSVVWHQQYGNPSTDYAYSIAKTYDGNYMIAGTYSDTGFSSQDRLTLLKITGQSAVIWCKQYGTFGFSDDISNGRASLTSDSGYIAMGSCAGFGGSDIYVTKINADGYSCSKRDITTSSYISADHTTNDQSTIQNISLTVSSPVITSNNRGFQDIVCSTAPCAMPTIQAKNITFSNVTSSSMTVSWTYGNGSRRLVKIKTSNSFTYPSQYNDYSASAVYSGGEQIIYNGTGNSVTVTGLAPHTMYWFEVFEANCSGNNSMYKLVAATGNPKQKKTLAAPPYYNPNRPESEPEESLSNSLLLYPNPTSDNITLESGEENPILSITVYSADGRMVNSIDNLHSTFYNLHLEGLSAGIYMLDCRTENGSEKIRVVKY